jgi:hypothetical protein
VKKKGEVSLRADDILIVSETNKTETGENKMNEFNKATVRQISNEIETAIQEVAKKHGIILKRGNCRFSSSTFSLKIEAAVVAQDGTVQSKERKDFEFFAKFIGLDPSILDKTFTLSGKRYKVTGYLPRSKRYPILCQDLQTGRGIKFPIETIQSVIG